MTNLSLNVVSFSFVYYTINLNFTFLLFSFMLHHIATDVSSEPNWKTLVRPECTDWI